MYDNRPTATANVSLLTAFLCSKCNTTALCSFPLPAVKQNNHINFQPRKELLQLYHKLSTPCPGGGRELNLVSVTLRFSFHLSKNTILDQNNQRQLSWQRQFLVHSQRIFLATDQTPKPKFVTSVPTTASVQFTQLFTALSAPVASHYHPYPAAFPLQTTPSPGAELRGMARRIS